MSELWDEIEQPKPKRTHEGTFKKGVSGNPLGRPKADPEIKPGIVDVKRELSKPGPKSKKGLDFELDTNFVDAADSINKNGKEFLKGIWKKIKAGDERLTIEMLKIVSTKMSVADDHDGLKDLDGIDLNVLMNIQEEMKD